MSTKKGMAPIEVLGTAAIVIAVVLIILVVFTRGIGRGEQAYVSCEGKGGICVSSFPECGALGRPANPVLKCSQPAEQEGRKTCCL